MVRAFVRTATKHTRSLRSVKPRGHDAQTAAFTLHRAAEAKHIPTRTKTLFISCRYIPDVQNKDLEMPDELAINTSASALDMANTIFGEGVTVVSASFSGSALQSGIYSGGTTTSPGVVPSDSGVILSTGLVTDFTTEGPDANILSGTSTDYSEGGAILNGNAQLTAMAGNQTYDAAIFSATFIPTGTLLTMQIVFASEEYLEWVNSGYNDIVAIWVNGQQAELTIGSGDISIDNINQNTNSNLYIDNPETGSDNVYNTEMDGFTMTLTLKVPVIPNAENTIIFAIADTGDGNYDSNLLIAANSVQVSLIANDDAISLRKSESGVFDLLANDESTLSPVLTITQINGIDVQPGDTVVLDTGQSITLNPDGTVTVGAAGLQTQSTFSYTIGDGSGNSDVGFVTVNSVPCFTAGTMIAVPGGGHRRIEALEPGDLVMTLDHGPQPVRWIARSLRRAIGNDAPILIDNCSLLGPGRLRLSSNHAVLLRNAQAELLFGCPEVLIRAKDLLGLPNVSREATGRAVMYFHLMLDRHEVVTANGIAAETYLPGSHLTQRFDPDTQEALAQLTEGKRITSARPILKRHEAPLLAMPPAQRVRGTPDSNRLSRATIR